LNRSVVALQKPVKIFKYGVQRVSVSILCGSASFSGPEVHTKDTNFVDCANK